MSHAITVSNGGSGATKNIHFAVEKELADKVVFIEATAGSASDKTYLRVSETKLSSNKVGSLENKLLSYRNGMYSATTYFIHSKSSEK